MHEQFENLAALAAIDALTSEERERLDHHLGECDACREVAAEYGDVGALLAYAAPAAMPPAEVKEALLSEVRAHRAVGEIQAERARRLGIRTRPQWWLAAAALFFLALFGWSEMRLRTMREQIAEIEAARDSLAEENRRIADERRQLAGQVEQLSSSGTRMLTLVGQELAPQARARAFMNEKNRTALIFFEALPPNPPDKSYQLWIMRADRPQPQPAGVFSASEEGKAEVLIREFPAGTEVKALAVTLEPRGGADAPTGAKYLIGTL